MTEQPPKRVTFMCCFCGEDCPGDTQIAMITNAGTDKETEQYWFAHFGCFERALIPKARVFDEFDDEDMEGEKR